MSHHEGAIAVSKVIGVTSTATGAAAFAEQQVSWLGLHAPEITAIAGLISIVGVLTGLLMNSYYNRKQIQIMLDERAGGES